MDESHATSRGDGRGRGLDGGGQGERPFGRALDREDLREAAHPAAAAHDSRRPRRAHAQQARRALFSDLGIAASHSRPRVSNDNPFSEAQFRTFKYRPEFPKRFGALEHARAICHDLLPWYNDAHHHSGPAISRRPTWITDARRRSSTCVTAPASWSTPRIQSNSSADHHTQKPCRPMDQSTVENDPPGCPKTDDRHPGRLAACGRCPAATAARSVVVSPRRWRGVATVNAEPDCLKDVDTARRAYADYEMPNALEDAPGRPSERLPAKHDRNHVP